MSLDNLKVVEEYESNIASTQKLHRMIASGAYKELSAEQRLESLEERFAVLENTVIMLNLLLCESRGLISAEDTETLLKKIVGQKK